MAGTYELKGHIKSAVAAKNNPLQTIVRFVLTDFEPNSNNQAIPISEASNIVTSALNQPLKILFNGISEQGHSRAKPVGPITHVELVESQIIAQAIIWANEFPDESSYLKAATSEGETIGTSWEILYGRSESNNGVEWLYDTLFSGTAIVKDPAYGNRTRLLAVAEIQSPPNYVRSALRKGLELHEAGRSGDGLRTETVAWARRLANGEAPSAQKVIDAVAWFARHEKTSKTPGWDTSGEETPGYVAWLLWGDNGDGRGKAWWEKQRDQLQEGTMNNEEKDALMARINVALSMAYQEIVDVGRQELGIAEFDQIPQAVENIAAAYKNKNKSMETREELAKTIEALQAERDQFKAQAEELMLEREQSELFAKRLSALAEIGVEYTAEQAEQKRGFLLAFSDELFQEYVNDMKELKPTDTKPAEAEKKGSKLSKLQIPEPMNKQDVAVDVFAAFVNENYK